MKNSCLTFFVFLLMSCGSKNKQIEVNNDSEQDSIISSVDIETNEDEYGEDYEAYFRNYNYEGIKAFEPRAYNLSDYSQQLFNIMDTISGLFVDNNMFYVKECRITKNNVFENDCNGAALIEPSLDTQTHCLYLFRGLKKYSKEKQVNLVNAGERIWVDKQENFDMNGVSYTLKAEGDVLNARGKGTSEYYEEIVNYKLYLSDGSRSQCILRMKSFDDTMTEICFVGDLDGDKKPDFIIKSPSSYEDYRLLLFLSSYSEGNELVKLVSILVDSFDC